MVSLVPPPETPQYYYNESIHQSVRILLSPPSCGIINLQKLIFFGFESKKTHLFRQGTDSLVCSACLACHIFLFAAGAGHGGSRELIPFLVLLIQASMLMVSE
jgi:hypothetical protein